MATETEKTYTLGEHIKLDDGAFWLPVRFCDQQTLFEQPQTGDVFLVTEKFIELHDVGGKVRFISLTSTRTAATRTAGPCKGVKPYFWLGGQIG